MRAYTFVLREKQREIIPIIKKYVEEFHEQQSDDLDDYLAGSVEALRSKIESHFHVRFHDDFFGESLDPEYLSGPVAEQLLLRDPPKDMLAKRVAATPDEVRAHVLSLVLIVMTKLMKQLDVTEAFGGTDLERIEKMALAGKRVLKGRILDRIDKVVEIARDKAHSNMPGDTDEVEAALEWIEAKLSETLDQGPF